jgi:hypothetical protein
MTSPKMQGLTRQLLVSCCEQLPMDGDNDSGYLWRGKCVGGCKKAGREGCVCVCKGEEGTTSMAGQHERPKFKAAQNSTK